MNDVFAPDGERDPQYPDTMPPDPVYPGQTRIPLAAPLDEIATPAMWSRLQGPLTRALGELWTSLGLADAARPGQWVAIHYGRIALNAHAWERLRARCLDEEPDRVLVEPPETLIEHLGERIERLRARWRHRRFERRIERAGERRSQALERMTRVDLAELDTAQLARGPLDDVAWCEVLLPWLGEELCGERGAGSDREILSGLAIEQRWAWELGRRLATRGQIQAESQVAYLTVPERIRCVHEDSDYWAELANERMARIDRFTKLDVPVAFWGRPRLDELEPGAESAAACDDRDL